MFIFLQLYSKLLINIYITIIKNLICEFNVKLVYNNFSLILSNKVIML